jgi:CRP/FNR family transcriptional regulator
VFDLVGERVLGGCLVERLSHFLVLTAREEAALNALEQNERSFRRGTVVRHEQDPGRELFIVRSGWLYSCTLLGNGNRQIMRLHFPGDLVGMSTLAFGKSADTLAAVTDISLCPFDKDRLAILFADHPRLAALLFTLTIAERVSLADRLASIGRTSARARVGSLICEISARLRLMDGAADDGFHMPMTQEDIGDATGLTAVHVNRMMRCLAEDGLIERNGSHVRLLDEPRLAQEAGFVDRFARIDTSWLPPSR